MSAIKSQYSMEFDRLMQAHRDMLVEGLLNGSPEDHAAYRQLVGRLQGIGDALKLSEQADYNLSGDDSAG